MIEHQIPLSHGAFRYHSVVANHVRNHLHFHNTYEICYIIEGEINCKIRNTDFKMSKGQLVFCFPNQLHQYIGDENSSILTIAFSCDFVYTFYNLTNKTEYNNSPFQCSEIVQNLLNDYLKNRLPQDLDHNLLFIKSLLYAICSEYIKNSELTVSNTNNAETFDQIFVFIAENYQDNISLNDLSNHLNYTYDYTSKLFKKVLGMSFSEYLNVYRFNIACDLLSNTSNSITRIALDCGFQNTRTFNNVFLKYAGVSPNAYRATLKDRYNPVVDTR